MSLMDFLSAAQDYIPQGGAVRMTLSGGGSTVDFPILPESFSVSVSSGNSTVNINNAGEYAMIGKTGLHSISFSSFFPAQRYHIVKSLLMTQPYAYIRRIENMRTSGEPLHFTVASTCVDLPVLIDSFSYSEKDGSRDVYFSLTLKEYRYIDGIDKTILSSVSGLMSRPLPSLKDVATSVLTSNDSPIQAIGRAIGIAKNPAGTVLDTFRDLAKGGGFSVGDKIDGSSFRRIVDSHFIMH